jgi:hypothetical protein
MRSEAIEAIGPDRRRLRIEFVWKGDRYAQLIALVDASGTAQPLLESIEGTAHDAWPPSPPLQNLTIETRPDGSCVALLLGMAGNAHWSASIEAAADKAALVFDIACRHSTNPGALGGRYRLLTDSKDLISIRADSANISQHEGTLEIQPIAASTSAGTTRWRYEIKPG